MATSLALNSKSPTDVLEAGKKKTDVKSFRKLDVRKLSDFGNDDIVTTMKQKKQKRNKKLLVPPL